MLFGSHSVISIEDLQPLDSQEYYRLSRTVDRVTEALKQTDTGKMKSYVEETFREAVDSNLPPDLIRQLSFDLIMKSVQAVGSIGIDPEESMSRLDSIYVMISRCENLKEAEQLVFSFLEEMAVKINEKRNQRGKNDTIDRMLVYIREHFRENDLSLDRLAQEFHLSPTYISKLFKEYTESNFIDYIIEIRINASKEMLLGKDMKVNEIAEAVGYMNTRSFLRTFKKYTGMTPTEYRDWAAKSQINDPETKFGA
jgi:two-component system response regulator YesN